MSVVLKSSVAVAMIALAVNGAHGQNPHECIREKAPDIKNNLIHLQYDSWVKPTGDGGRFHFDRCVLNHEKKKRVFVDWVDTGAKGVTDSDGLVRGGLEAPTNDHEQKKTNLIYGIARASSQSTYLEVKKFQAGPAPSIPGSLRSYAKMGLPIGGLESGPDFVVVDIDVEFESAAMKLSDGTYLYTYSWRDRLADKRGEEAKVFIAWPDKFVTHATTSKDKNPSVLSTSSQGGYAIAKEAPRFTTVTVDFRDASDKNKRSLGTARVSILRPKVFDGQD